MAGAWLQSRTFEMDLNLLIFCFLLQFFYQWLFLRYLGGTLGKLIFGLRVVNKANGGGLSFIQSFLRVLTDQLSLLFGHAHRVLVFARFDRTHLSDWVAETQVRQTSPREDHPKRNIPVALILALYFAVSGFYQAYQIVQRTELDHGKIIFHPLLKDGDFNGDR